MGVLSSDTSSRAAGVPNADNANPSTGDSPVKVKVWYRVVSNPAV